MTYIFFQHFEYIILPPSGLIVSNEKSVVDLTEDPLYMMSHFSLAAFNILFGFEQLFMMCLSEDFLEFILLRDHGASWMCRLIFFIRLGKFSAIIFSNILFSPFSLSPLLWDSYYVCVGMHDGVCNEIDLSSISLILSSAHSNLLLSPLMKFSF